MSGKLHTWNTFVRLISSTHPFAFRRCIAEYTTTRVLVAELLTGTWISDILADDRSDKRASGAYREIAATLFEFFMEEIFELGFFHSDPHPGNICILEDGRVGLIDFGMIGYLTGEAQRAQLSLLSAIQRQSVDEAYLAITTLLNVPPDAETGRFRRLFESNIRTWTLQQYQPKLPLSRRSAGNLLLANFKAARECGLSFTTVAIRYYRAFLILDSVLIRLDDEFDESRHLESYLQARFHRQKMSIFTSVLSDYGTRVRMQVFEFIQKIPSMLRRLETFTGPASLVEGAFSQILSRMSTLAQAASRLSVIVAVISLVIFLTSLINPSRPLLLIRVIGRLADVNTGIVYSFSGKIVLGAIVSTATFAWLSRILWVRAYKPEGYLRGL